MAGRTLQLAAIEEALATQGLSQAKIAKLLDVSREAVSKWFKGTSSPRPDKLLDLALLLERDIDDISAIATDEFEPRIAFRKKGNAKITADFISHAKHIGRVLEPLTDFLPFEQLVTPKTLKNPNLDFEYLERAAILVRKKANVRRNAVIEFPDIVGLFADFQAVLVPTLWGTKQNHKNALHIYLPKSTTTWVFLNLDTYAFDFLFWMSHELGHVLTPELRGEEAEDFADAFAGALLFPAQFCEDLEEELARKRTDSSRLSTICSWADDFGISPITLTKRVNAFRAACDEPPYDFGNSLYAAATNLNKRYLTVAEAIIGEGETSAKDYIKHSEAAFKTPFFDVLRQYAAKEEPDASFYQTVLDISLSDAKALRTELC